MKPAVFVGSSKKNIGIAKLVANGLDECAEAVVWDEGVFDFNRSIFESLMSKINEFDYAVLILAGDDVTFDGVIGEPSTRDNVILECGLFLGKLGKDRVFLLSDASVDLRIPSDLAGVVLIPFDRRRFDTEYSRTAVRQAIGKIQDKITKHQFGDMTGSWRSRYVISADEKNPVAEDDVDISHQ